MPDNILPNKRFSRRKEDFTCLNCGFVASGNGYTDHCPACLFSRHVDIFPGDRQESCQGLMEPIGVTFKSGKSVIYYRCLKCGKRHRVKTSPADNQEKIIKLASNVF